MTPTEFDAALKALGWSRYHLAERRERHMNRMEKAALGHAAEWLRYQRSPQYRRDMAADRKRRDELTLKQGHSLLCGILKCHPSCPRLACE